MLAKKLTASIAVLMAAAAISAPALADGYRGHHGHGYKHHKHVRTVIVHRPVVVHRYYRPAPRPVYVVHRPAPVYAPVAPVYYHHSGPEPVVPLLVGAVIGAAIVHHAVTSGY